MAESGAGEAAGGSLFDDRFMLKAFAVFAALAAASVLISVGGKHLGRSIALAGHTESQQPHEIVIGNDVLRVAANAIRFERDRRDGIAAGLRVYLRWPDMQGYSAAARDDFNHAGGSRNVLFLSFEPRMMSRDMSGRLEPIYRALIEPAGQPGPAGLSLHAFAEKSGYLNEVLAVGPEEAGSHFVARCLTGPMAAESLADCERDVFVGEELSLVYRFPSRLLPEWRRLEASVAAFAAVTIQAEK